MKRRAPLLLALFGALLLVGLVSWLLAIDPLGDPPGYGGPGQRGGDTARTTGEGALVRRDAALRESARLGDAASGGDHVLPLVATEQVAAEPDRDVKTLRLHGRLVDERNEPVSDVQVFFLPSRDERVRRGLAAYYLTEPMPWEIFTRTLSGEDGRFELAVQELSRPSGHRLKKRTGSFAVENSMLAVVRDGFATQLFELPEFGWELGLGELVMTPAASVSGRVVGPDAAPIAGARLTPVMEGAWPGGRWPALLQHAVVSTDEGGRFLLDRLPEAEYQLQVYAPGRRMGFAEVRALAGERLDVGALVLARGSRLAGRVVDEQGRPLAGAALTLRTASSRDALDAMDGDTSLVDTSVWTTLPGRYERRLETDADGRFLLDDLDPTPHGLWIRADHHQALQLRALAVDGEDVEVVLGPEALVVLLVVDARTQQAVTGASVHVARSRFASGEPFFDLAIPAVTGAQAVERLASREPADEVLEGAASDGEGVFVAGPAGFIANRITVSAPGYLDVTRSLPGVEAGAVLRETVALEAIASPATIRGRTTDAQGAPVPQVELVAMGGPGVPSRKALSEADGSFVFEGLAPGTWKLMAEHAEYLRRWKHDLLLEPDALLEDVVLQLGSGGRLAGRVTKIDGSPVPLQVVELRQASEAGRRSPQWTTLSDGDGRFRFRVLVPAPYVVSAPPGPAVSVELLAEQEAEVALQVRQPARLWGLVRDARGAPLATKVVLYGEHPDGRRETFDTESGETGRWRLDDLPAVRGRLVARRVEVNTPPIDLVLDWGDEQEHELVFGAGRIDGRVLQLGTQQPVVGVMVYASLEYDLSTHPGPHRLALRATSDAVGHFELCDLPAGSYALRTLSGSWVAPTPETDEVSLGEALVAAGGAVTQDLWVEPAATLAGRLTVVDPKLGATDHHPTLTLRLERLDQSEPLRVVRLKKAPEYSMTGLRGGRWRYTVGRHGYRWDTVEAGEAYIDGELTIPPGEITRLDLLVPLRDS